VYRYCLWIYIGLALLMAITCFFCVILDRTCVKMHFLIRAWYVRQFANTIAVNYALSRYIGRCHPPVPSITVTPSVLSITNLLFLSILVTRSTSNSSQRHNSKILLISVNRRLNYYRLCKNPRWRPPTSWILFLFNILAYVHVGPPT